MPGGASAGERTTTSSSSRWTTAYPRSSVAAGLSAWTRARVWARSARACSSSRRQPPAGAVAVQGDLLGAAAQALGGVGQGGPGAHRGQRGEVVADLVADRAQRPVAQPHHPGELFGHVGDHHLPGVGRGGGATVGDQVDQRGVRLVADRGDHRGRARRHRPAQRLVAEREQVLHRAAAAGEHDDVDLGRGVQRPQRRADLDHRLGALHRDLADLQHHPRPATAGVADDVLLRGRRPTGDQAHPPRQERQRLLAAGRGQALADEDGLETLDPQQQLAGADGPDLADRQAQGAAREVEVWATRDHHPGALDQRGPDRVGHRPRAGQRQRDLGDRVAQGEEHRAGAARDLGDLPLHPDRAEPVHPTGDGLRDGADRHRPLGAGVEGHGARLVRGPHRRLSSR